MTTKINSPNNSQQPLAFTQVVKKEADKAAAQVDPSLSVWTMDLQAVLLSPKLQASALYYRTKLACHNFTMYDLVKKTTLCYFWHESEGDLSASRFASCVLDNLTKVVRDNKVTKIIVYSDGCGYQNRNMVLANALLEFCVINNVELFKSF